MKKKLNTIFTKDIKIHCILLFVVAICFLSITTVYSALYTTMDISGTAYARIEADVRITDFRLASANNATSSFEEFGKSHIVTDVSLNDSSSSITYYLEITNYGSVDIGIFDITGLPEGVNYSIKDYNLRDKICDDTGKCNSFITKTYEVTLTTTNTYSGSVQLNFDFRTYHSVTYTDITNNGYPVEVIDGGDLVITFGENLKRVLILSDGNELDYYSNVSSGETITINNITNDVEVKLKEKVVIPITGPMNQVGDEICIGSECFYIISNDGETVTLLSKYNLLVGNRVDSGTSSVPLENPTGIQDSTSLGYNWSTESSSAVYPYIGTTSFSSSSHQGTNLSDYDGSIVKDYVDDYGVYLNSLGVVLNNARLITYDELIGLGCDSSSGRCSNAPNWVRGTSYWAMSATDTEHVWYVYTNANFGSAGYNTNTSYFFGVRPVIELSVDEIAPFYGVVSGDLDSVGSEVCIDKECFYVISSTDDTVTMLAKYNLHVGGEYSNSTWTAYENATGIQDSTMLAHNNGSPYNGTSVFSTTGYWSKDVSTYPAYVYDENSSLYVYVENYKNYLENVISIKEARLISIDELDALGCNISSVSCSAAPSWVIRSAYWTGNAKTSSTVFYVARSNSSANGMLNAFFGVRPVITVYKSDLSK